MDLSGPGIDVKLKERKKERWTIGEYSCITPFLLASQKLDSGIVIVITIE